MERDPNSNVNGRKQSRRRVLEAIGSATAASVGGADVTGADHEGDDDLAGLRLATRDGRSLRVGADRRLPLPVRDRGIRRLGRPRVPRHGAGTRWLPRRLRPRQHPRRV